MTFKAAFATILDMDARLTAAGTLGDLMGYNAVTRPDLVFFGSSPQQIVPPKITYRMETQLGLSTINHVPRRVILTVTAWGNNFDAVQKRVFELIHKRGEISADDYYVENILYEGSGPELWDEDLKCYYRVDRYAALLATKP